MNCNIKCKHYSAKTKHCKQEEKEWLTHSYIFFFFIFR